MHFLKVKKIRIVSKRFTRCKANFQIREKFKNFHISNENFHVAEDDACMQGCICVRTRGLSIASFRKVDYLIYWRQNSFL